MKHRISSRAPFQTSQEISSVLLAGMQTDTLIAGDSLAICEPSCGGTITSPSSLWIPQLPLGRWEQLCGPAGTVPVPSSALPRFAPVRGYYMRSSLVKGETTEHFHYVCSSARSSETLLCLTTSVQITEDLMQPFYRWLH